MTDRQIVEIIPADGWRAVVEEGTEGRVAHPLVGWALVEERADPGPVTRLVVGLVTTQGEVGFADRVRGFTRYLGPGKSLHK